MLSRVDPYGSLILSNAWTHRVRTNGYFVDTDVATPCRDQDPADGDVAIASV
jgi:hypothetical protein